MTNQLQLLPPPDTAEFISAAKQKIRTILQSDRQPSAGELLRELQQTCGWQVRYLFPQVIRELRDDKSLAGYLREYLRSALADDEITATMREGTNPTPQEKSTLDDLFRNSILYRNSATFKEALEFSAKFRDYAPYNNMLVRIQNPSCSYYATARDWERRFKRRVKEDAKPMIILAPMHPVMLVYDLDETEGPDIPEHLRNFARAEGAFKTEWLHRTIENAERMRIQVQRKPLSQLHGGFATTRLYDSARFKMRVVVHQELTDVQAYAVLCHELGHVLLGHLGTDRDHWWPCRIGLTHAAVEIEAESVSFMVATRLGLQTAAAAYLAGHAKDGQIPPGVSLDLIVKVASKIEEMGSRLLPPKKPRPPSERGRARPHGDTA